MPFDLVSEYLVDCLVNAEILELVPDNTNRHRFLIPIYVKTGFTMNFKLLHKRFVQGRFEFFKKVHWKF